MNGAVAAGHPLTAETGAAAIRAGGNAVDAAIASAFAAAVLEGPLTGPGGGGFLLLHVDGEPLVLDCFFAVPSRPAAPMEELVIDFIDAGEQVFHIGEGSVAVPGLVQGLEEAHRRFGRLEWSQLVQPAVELAQVGYEPGEAQAFLHEILAGILLRDEGGRSVYGDPVRIRTGELTATLESIRDRGAAAVAELLPEFADELAAYRVEEREPLRGRFRGRDVLANPAPSRGGQVVVTALERIDELGVAAALAAGYGGPTPGRITGTTHVSVIDGDGNAASFSSTLGSGSGVFRGGAQLNNMLGELDVIGPGEHPPGERLASMMTPTLVLDAGKPRLVIGSAGSVRLAGAIAQVTWRILRGAHVADAIGAPRVHVDGATVHLEGGWSDAEAATLPADWNVVRWEGINLFFGGVQAVERTADGLLYSAGDPRRGGVGLVVE